LFQIIQLLRRSSRPVTAREMAGELEVSVRTVYRDVADLIGQRVPIQGEAGFGYVLGAGYDMPPLMLTPDEIEAAVLGAQWVAGRGDPALANAGRPHAQLADGIDIARTRRWIREGRKIRLAYRDESGAASERVIWPIVIGYFNDRRTLAAWCELRGDFRHFRADRVAAATFLDDRHGERPGALRQRWMRMIRQKGGDA
jgi:predicted DNA-binding transcriptional regulator YafY